MDYTNTIDRLNKAGKLCQEAAEAIAVLTAKAERLEQENRRLQELTHSQRNGLEQLREELEQVKRERDAATTAVDRMAKYIVAFGRVDYWLCDDIPKELHLKHQPKNDGNYENGPCIECVKEYYLRGPQKEE